MHFKYKLQIKEARANMFYILNQDNQIVAADYDLLEILEADDLQTLFVKVVSGEIAFQKLDDRKVNIQSRSSLVRASHEEYLIKTTFGDLTLVKLYNIIVKSASEKLMNSESLQTHKEQIEESKVDVTPKKASIFLDDEEEKSILKPKKVSIFIDDDEETPVKEEPKVEPIADIPNAKVQEDLEFASQKLKEEKVDKKPVLETLRVEEEDLQLDEMPLSEESVEEEPTLSIDEPQESVEEDLKLAGIDLEEREEDEASIDELLALADEQAQEQSIQKEEPKEEPVEEMSLALDEEEPEEEPQDELSLDDGEFEEDLKLAGIALEEDEPTLAIEEEKEPLLTLEEEAKEEEIGIDEGLLVAEEEETALALDDEPLQSDNIEEFEELLALDEEPEEQPLTEEPKVEEEVGEFDDLLMLDDEPKAQSIKEEPIVEEEIEEFDDLLLLDDEPKKDVVKETPKVEEVEEFDDLLLLDDEPKKEVAKEKPKEEEFDDLFLLDDEKPQSKPVRETPKEEVDEIKELLSEIDEQPKVEMTPIRDYDYPDTIEIDLDEYGEMIGLGADDFKEFLNEFIDKSIVYDEELRSEDDDKRNGALDELLSISQSLQLPYVEDILQDMLDRGYLEEELVDIYFDCLAKVTTKSQPKPEVTTSLSEETSLFEDNTPKEESAAQVEEVKEEAPQVSPNGYGVLSFEGIKPIHFDFRLEEAAEDLSLPVDLIEEFVNDFIEQAIEEKETFIKAYAEGDMDTIQKTGHKLKGASSNLRIIPLSETLEEIQHCETPARFEPLLKKYWGQFLSFKLFMENISR